jgi:hypothetical protein
MPEELTASVPSVGGDTPAPIETVVPPIGWSPDDTLATFQVPAETGGSSDSSEPEDPTPGNVGDVAADAEAEVIVGIGPNIPVINVPTHEEQEVQDVTANDLADTLGISSNRTKQFVDLSVEFYKAGHGGSIDAQAHAELMQFLKNQAAEGFITPFVIDDAIYTLQAGKVQGLAANGSDLMAGINLAPGYSDTTNIAAAIPIKNPWIWAALMFVGATAGGYSDTAVVSLDNLLRGIQMVGDDGDDEPLIVTSAPTTTAGAPGLPPEDPFEKAKREAAMEAACAATNVPVCPTDINHIVLGLRNFGLETTAKNLGGRTLLGDLNWQNSLVEAIANPKTKFSISLDGLSGSSTYSKIMSAAQNGMTPNAQPTNWEIAQIYQAGRLKDVDFYIGTALQNNPFK